LPVVAEDLWVVLDEAGAAGCAACGKDAASGKAPAGTRTSGKLNSRLMISLRIFG